jgi:glycosyltransferase involved in cell wall biosynthesis
MMQKAFDVSVVTPSFNMLGYLQRCHRSVVDQEDVAVEHIVMDGGSTDGTPEWLEGRADLRRTVARDEGMYDAVNKGIAQAGSDIIAYLNCDEQYLPGTLAYVRDFFTGRPEIDFLFGSVLLVRPDSGLIAYRKAYPPHWPLIAASHLYVLSCAMFVRRRVFAAGHHFDPALKDVADWKFVIACLRSGYGAAYTSRYFSAFTMTGANRSTDPAARAEEAALRLTFPHWVRALKAPLNVCRLGLKVAAGAYRQRFPLRYEIYAKGADEGRTVYTARDASFRWRTG